MPLSDKPRIPAQEPADELRALVKDLRAIVEEVEADAELELAGGLRQPRVGPVHRHERRSPPASL